jgi:hypothetical protein
MYDIRSTMYDLCFDFKISLIYKIVIRTSFLHLLCDQFKHRETGFFTNGQG